MATIKYLLQSKSEIAPIYLRLSLGRVKGEKSKYISFKRKTGLNINPKDWSIDKSLPKQNIAANKKMASRLRGLSKAILDDLNDANSENVEVSGEWLNTHIDIFFKRNTKTDLDKLTNYGLYFLDNLPYKVSKQGKSGVAKSTQKKYKTIVNKLTLFEKKRKKTIFIKDVDSNLRSELIQYFVKVDKLSDNTIGRYLKFVKSICLDAKRNGIEVNPQLEYFKGYSVKVPKITLSFDELEKIKKTALVNENHEIAKDWLIIGCYTGQRVSDLLRMNKGFINNIQNFEFIVLEQIKTGKTVQIPIHNEVKEILNKRNGEFPPKFNINADSNSVLFNRYLKQLCEIAKINTKVEGNAFDKKTKRTVKGMYEKYKLVSSHICRRSFATNFYGNPKFPTPILMNITAHSTEKMFLEYIGKKPIEYGLQLAKIWADEVKKAKKEPQLTVVKQVSNQ